MKPTLTKAALAAVAAVFALAAAPIPARADEVVVVTAGAMAAPLRAVAPAFSRASGHTLGFFAGPTGVVLPRLRGPEPADVVVVSLEAARILTAEGRIVPGSERPLATAVLGLAVKSGAAHPDLSTPEALRRTLTNARSLALPDPALRADSGVFMTGVFEQWGVRPAMAAKTRLAANGGAAAAAVARGEAELAISFTSELASEPGVEVVGTLPEPLRHPSAFVVAVSASAAHPAAARAFVAYVTGPEAGAGLAAAGVVPAQAAPGQAPPPR